MSKNMKKLSELKVVELRNELERRGLDKNGVKASLVDRLATDLKSKGLDPNQYKFAIMTEQLRVLGKRGGVTSSVNYKRFSANGSTNGIGSPPDLSSSSSHSTHFSDGGGPRSLLSSAVSVSNTPADYYGSMPRGLGLDFTQAGPPALTSHHVPTTQTKPFPLAGSQISQPAAAPPHLQYPLYPDVRFKSLPFFEVMNELLKPATLMPTTSLSRFQENTFTFHLTPQQANDIAMSRDVKPGGKIEFTVQIQLRFCLMETSCDQEDNFPPSICVKINTKMCPLPNPLPTNKPGVEPKRPSRPVSITPLCRLSPTVTNQISISWASEYSRPYAIGIFLVRKLTSHNLLSKIRGQGIRNADHTRAMIKEKLAHDPDSEIATMILRGSLLCPLGKMRMQIPCRALTCSHIQCFDALLYLQMNEKKPTWICPVCDKQALFKHLAIDGLFKSIIDEAPGSCTEVQFHEDGSWTPVIIKKESRETVSVLNSKKSKKRESSPEPEAKRKKVEVITLDSDDDDDDHQDRPALENLSTPLISSESNSSSPTNIQSLPSPDSSTNSSGQLNTVDANPTLATTVGSNIVSSSSNFSRLSNFSRSPTTSVSTSSPSNSLTPNINRSGAPSSSLPTVGSTGLSSPFSGMPILNANTPPFYPSSTSYPFPDFLAPHGAHSLYNYSGFDFNLNQFFQSDNQDRQMSSFRNSMNPLSQRSLDLDPDIISID